MSNKNLYVELFSHYAQHTLLQLLNGKQYSYADLDKLAGHIAGLYKHHGVCKGDRVIIFQEKSINTLAAYLAMSSHRCCVRATQPSI